MGKSFENQIYEMSTSYLYNCVYIMVKNNYKEASNFINNNTALAKVMHSNIKIRDKTIDHIKPSVLTSAKYKSIAYFPDNWCKRLHDIMSNMLHAYFDHTLITSLKRTRLVIPIDELILLKKFNKLHSKFAALKNELFYDRYKEYLEYVKSSLGDIYDTVYFDIQTPSQLDNSISMQLIILPLNMWIDRYSDYYAYLGMKDWYYDTAVRTIVDMTCAVRLKIAKQIISCINLLNNTSINKVAVLRLLSLSYLKTNKWAYFIDDHIKTKLDLIKDQIKRAIPEELFNQSKVNKQTITYLSMLKELVLSEQNIFNFLSGKIDTPWLNTLDARFGAPTKCTRSYLPSLEPLS